MNRLFLNSFVLILCQICLAQNQNNVWVFGRGNVLDFNTNPPSLNVITWSPTSPFNANVDVNASNTWCDEDGNLLVYFLNGKYYNENGVPIPGGQVAGYHNVDFNGSYLPCDGGSFCQSYYSDTIYHYYSYQPLQNGVYVPGYRIMLNALWYNGQNWVISELDKYPEVNNTFLDMNPMLINDDVDNETFLIVNQKVLNGDNNKIVRITNDGFRNCPNTGSINAFDNDIDVVDAKRAAFYHPLLQRYFASSTFGSPRDSWRWFSWRTLGNYIFSRDSIEFPVVEPGKTGVAAYSMFSITATTTSLDGKYLYCMAYFPAELGQKAHCYRYDLLSADSLSFVQNAVEVQMDTTLSIWNIQDIEIAPDGNIYFPLTAQNWQNSPNSRRIGRIVNAGDPDTSNIYFDYHFATLAPYSVYHSFPYFSSKQALPPPFKLLSDCSDSVSFDFTYKNVPDSVWWDFGDTTLGPLNHSTDKEPVVHYPSFGKRYVSVEMWLRGDSINRVGDTIDVQPSPHVSLPNDTLLCSGESITLDASQGFHADYLWSTGSTDSTLTVSQSGAYWVEVQNFCGTSRDTFNLVVIDPPQPVLRDTTLCDEWTYVMRVFADSADYLWNTGDTSPSIVPQSSSNYWVQISNPCGEIVDEADIEIRRCMCNVWIPSAFTPNGDGVNETFEIKVDCRDFDFTLDIFNRWGEHIYRQTDLNKPWDGRYNGEALPRGIYTYRIQYWGRDEQGLRWKDETGTINLLQ